MLFSLEWCTDFGEDYDQNGLINITANSEDEAITKAKKRLPYKALILNITVKE